MKLKELLSRAKTKLKRLFSFAKRRKMYFNGGSDHSESASDQRYTPMKSSSSVSSLLNMDKAGKKKKLQSSVFSFSPTEKLERKKRFLGESKNKRRSQIISIAAVTEGVAQLRKEIEANEAKLSSECVGTNEPQNGDKIMVDHIEDITLQFGSLLHVTLNQLNTEKTSGPKIIYTHRKKSGFTSNRTQLVAEVVEEFQKHKNKSSFDIDFTK